MKVLVAPDSFKGSLSAVRAARAMQRGVRRALGATRVDRCPLADGGEGTAEVLIDALGGELRRVRVTGPLTDPVDAAWGWLPGSVAVVETASAAGLPLVPEASRNPLCTTTFGVGELVRCALDEGARSILVGLGGSATTDGGSGAAQALGVTFEGGALPMTGAALQSLRRVDPATRDRRLERASLTALCDVDAPLLGPAGAARAYSPQKGANTAEVEQLERGLAHLAQLVGPDVAVCDGDGAAGGMGFGWRALLGASLVCGTEVVFERVGLRQRLSGCDLVLTGEGQLDAQSVSGKVVGSVVREAQRAGVPVHAIVGSAGAGVQQVMAAGLGSYEELVHLAGSLEVAHRDAERWIEVAASRAMRIGLGGPRTP